MAVADGWWLLAAGCWLVCAVADGWWLIAGVCWMASVLADGCWLAKKLAAKTNLTDKKKLAAKKNSNTLSVINND